MLSWFRKRPTEYSTRVTLEQLEERIVLDATVAGSPDDHQDQSDSPSQLVHDGTQLHDPTQTTANVPQGTVAVPAQDPVAHILGQDLNKVLVSNAADVIPPASVTGTPSNGVHVLVVSSMLADAQDLVAAAKPGVMTVLYDGVHGTPESLLASLQTALAGNKADSIAFASHNDGDAQFHLVANYLVSPGSLASDTAVQAFWQGVGGLLTQNGRVDLMACNVTASAAGTLLTSQLADLTGHQVAASVDDTGNPAAGGNWILETGNIDLVGLYFSPTAIQNFTGTLAGHTTLVNTAPQDGDLFGNSVAISGSWAIVGAPGDNPGGTDNAGSVYFYERDAGTGSWALQDTEANPAAAADDVFGVSVSISGDWAIVGASGDNPGDKDNAGSVYFYKRSGSTWALMDTETDPAARADDFFGLSVSISGDWAIVGAEGSAPVDEAGSGLVYFYKLNGAGTGWDYQETELNPTPFAGDAFGSAVSISGNRAIVGAYGHDVLQPPHNILRKDAGAVYFYELSGGSWSLKATRVNPDPLSNDRFGAAVAISGDWAIVGAYLDDGAGSPDAGSIYFYGWSGSDWSTTPQWGTSELARGDSHFGFSVAIAGDMAVVGEPEGYVWGAVQFYSLSGSTWQVAYRQENFEPSPTEADEFGEAVGISSNPDGTHSAVVGDTQVGLHEAGPGLAYAFVVDRPPTDITLSNNVIAESSAPQTTVGVLGAVDPDIGDTFTFSLEAEVDDNDLFDVQGNFLLARTSLDYETATSHTIQVTVTDAAGAELTKTFTITVTPVNDEPIAKDRSATVNEDAATPLLDAAGWSGAFEDHDAAVAAHSTPAQLIIVSTADLHGTLKIGGVAKGDGSVIDWSDLPNLTYLSDPNYNGSASFTFKVQDAGGNAPHDVSLNTATFNITVSPANDQPVNTVTPVAAVAEDSASVNLGPAFRVTDVDSQHEGDTWTVKLDSTSGFSKLNVTGFAGVTITDNATQHVTLVSSDLAALNIVLGSLQGNLIKDFNGNAGVKITTTDSHSASDSDTLLVTVTAVNDAPVVTTPGAQKILNSQTVTFSVAKGNAITVTDVDAGTDPITVKLTGTSGKLKLGTTAGLTKILGNGTSLLTITGTVDKINTALNGLVFTPTSKFTGAAAIDVLANDGGKNGAGGALTGSGKVGITVTASSFWDWRRWW